MTDRVVCLVHAAQAINVVETMATAIMVEIATLLAQLIFNPLSPLVVQFTRR